MLHTLRIQNYALIDDVEVEFHSGFNVLTGETGAGKSIIIHALNLVLGARASSEAVRSGEKQARIDAIFRLSFPSESLQCILDDNTIELDGDELHISRIVSSEGRSRAYAGGILLPLGILASIGNELVDLHGQHEHQSLLHPEKQRELLDAYCETQPLAKKVSHAVAEWTQIRHEIETLESTDREQTRQLEFLKFELEEIEGAALKPDEETDLESRRNRITYAEAIYQSTAQIQQWLSTSETQPPALDLLGMSSRELETLAGYDEAYSPILDAIENLCDQVQTQLGEIQQLSESIEYDPSELDAINIRLNSIRDLKRKYGETIEAILAYADTVRERLTGHENRDARLAELKSSLSIANDTALKLAQKLSKERKKGAKILSNYITLILQVLGMSGAKFQLDFSIIPMNSTGIDGIEFQLMANPGEPAKAMRQVASGGEISRIMLAIKSVFAKTDAIATLIFDEIDTGIGGAVANQIAMRLKSLAQDHQTICITHLSQIAAAGDAHYHVSKATSKGKTTTDIRVLENEARVDEVARLLDGAITPLSKDHAVELLNELA